MKLLDRVVSGASFSTGSVFACDLAHRRSVAVLCMLNKMRCDPMHPHSGALPVPYVSVRITRRCDRTSVHTMRLLAAEPRSMAGLLFLCQHLCETILVTPYMNDCVGPAGFKSRANAFLLV